MEIINLLVFQNCQEIKEKIFYLFAPKFKKNFFLLENK